MIVGQQLLKGIQQFLHKPRTVEEGINLPLAGEVNGLPVVPLVQGRLGMALGPLVLLPLQTKPRLLLEGSGQLHHGLGMLIHVLTEPGHGGGLRLINPHAIGVAGGIDLKPQHRPFCPAVPSHTQGKPEMAFVGPPAIGAAGHPGRFGSPAP